MVFTSKFPEVSYPEDVSVYDILFRDNHHTPEDKIIYINADDPSESFTFGQLKTQILKAAAGLKREFNIQKGDVVAICSPNRIDYPVIVHGTVCAGGVVATINQDASIDKIAKDLDIVEAKILILHEDNLDNTLAAAKIAGIPQSHVLVFNDVGLKGVRCTDETIFGKDELADPPKVTSEQIVNDPAYLYFSSGTTGTSKVVTITQYAMVSTLLLKHEHRTNKQINALDYTRFHHVGPLIRVMHHFIYYGYTTYIISGFSVRQICENVQAYNIHIIGAHPSVCASLVKGSIVDEYDLSSLRYVLSSGTALDKSITRDLKKRFNITVFDVYAMTEAIYILITDTKVADVGGAGFLAPGFTAKLVDKYNNEVALGQIGELLIKGPTVTKGYYKNPEATSNLIDAEGYLRTKDLFTCNEDGMFTYIERSDDLIKYCGGNVFSSEIENVLLSHPKVEDCAAIGAYNPDLGTELPRAYVSLVDGEKYSEKVQLELEEYANIQLLNEKRLRGGLFIVDSFPRTASGKIQRRVLKRNAQKNVVAHLNIVESHQ